MGHRPSPSTWTLAVAVAVLAGVLAVPALAARSPVAKGDGTLSVQDGRGRFVLTLTGSVIGRIDRGKLVIQNPFASNAGNPIVRGHERVQVRGTTITYSGRGIRFRILGGRFNARIEDAVGVHLSVLGRGQMAMQGAGLSEFGLSNGLYSMNGGGLMPIPDERVVLPVRAPQPAARQPKRG
jgi:hypothetical protein